MRNRANSTIHFQIASLLTSRSIILRSGHNSSNLMMSAIIQVLEVTQSTEIRHWRRSRRVITLRFLLNLVPRAIEFGTSSLQEKHVLISMIQVLKNTSNISRFVTYSITLQNHTSKCSETSGGTIFSRPLREPYSVVSEFRLNAEIDEKNHEEKYFLIEMFP